MGNIPLPALDIRPAQAPEDPISQYAKVMQLKSMMGQQQLQGQQLVGAQQENQMRAMQIQDQQKIRQAAQDPSIDWTQPGAYDKLIQKATQSGVSPQTLLPLQQHVLDMRQKISATNKTDLENQVTQNDARRGKLLSIVQQKDPAAKQSTWDAELTAEEQAGNLKPGTIPHQYPGDDAATALANNLAQGSVLAKEAIEKQQADARMAQALKPTLDSFAATVADPKATPEAKAAAQKALDTINQLGITKAAQETQAKLNVENAPENVAAKVNTAARVSGAEASARVAAENSPTAIAGAANKKVAEANALIGGNAESLVDEIGQGKMALGRLSYVMARAPQLMEAVAQKYPDFDASKVQSYADTYKNFTSGKVSVQLNSGSTALQHLADLKKINDANPNLVRVPGSAPNKAYNNLLDTVADELGTFYGEPKTNEVIQSKKATLGGMLNRDAAIREQAQAMGQKFDEFENTWKNAAPSAAYQAPMPAYSEGAKSARAFLDPSYKPSTSAARRAAPNQPTPQTHVVSLAKALRDNPGKTPDQIRAAAKLQGYEVQ